jgi:hypothetical protein
MMRSSVEVRRFWCVSLFLSNHAGPSLIDVCIGRFGCQAGDKEDARRGKVVKFDLFVVLVSQMHGLQKQNKY